MNPCRHLRWKGYHGENRTPFATLADHPAARHAPCTCLRTSQPWGPDGNAVSVSDCHADRSCWEEPRRRDLTPFQKILDVFRGRRP